MIGVKDTLLIVLALAIGFAIWRIQSKLARVDELETANSNLTTQVANLEERAKLYDEALLEKARQEKWARDVRTEINRQLNEVRRNDAEADAYLGTVIPDSVRDAYRAGAVARPRSDADSADGSR